jgi:hypothetical protein
MSATERPAEVGHCATTDFEADNEFDMKRRTAEDGALLKRPAHGHFCCWALSGHSATAEESSASGKANFHKLLVNDLNLW